MPSRRRAAPVARGVAASLLMSLPGKVCTKIGTSFDKRLIRGTYKLIIPRCRLYGGFSKPNIYMLISPTRCCSLHIEATNFRNLSGRIEWGPRLQYHLRKQRARAKRIGLKRFISMARTKSFRHNAFRKRSDLEKIWQRCQRKSTTGQDLQRELQVSLHDNSKTIFVNSKRETLAQVSHTTPGLLVHGC